MLAGASSGCGKTTVALALLRALHNRGLRVAPFKAGPDYIDPGFHRAACGAISHNLDEWLMPPEWVRGLPGSVPADLSVIEGAMGFYDGLGGPDRCSAYTLARLTDTPVILVLDASGSAASAAATALGFLHYRQPSNIAGALVNRVSGERHFELVKSALHDIGLPCAGWLPKDAAISLPDRHLGLVPAGELPGLENQIERAAGLLHVDLDVLFAIARRAGALPASLPHEPPVLKGRRVAVASDAAFGFTYAAGLSSLERMGAELSYFSPLHDAKLPGGVDSLYLPGGFPEVFEGELTDNRPMAESVRGAVAEGLKVYAECGGMLYLSMIGALPVTWRMTDRLQRFGYVTLTDRDGQTFPAHEFHHSVTEGDLPQRFSVHSRRGDYREGYMYKNVVAGYPHVHFAGRPELARRLL